MSAAYVENRDGMDVVKGTRVSLDSIVYAFVAGESAEAIAEALRVQSLEQLYGAITYYLAHREDIERYLEDRRRHFAVARQATRDAAPTFYQKAHGREEALIAQDTRALRSAMQDIYAFDIGDFGKVGLLRHLHRGTGLR